MQTTPKSMRLQIALMGRVNVGKSTFLNQVAGQDVSITSPLAGTTTDVVEKPMELLPLGPVLFLDTAGLADPTALASARQDRTLRVFDRADVIVLLCRANEFDAPEQFVVAEARRRERPLILVATQADIRPPGAAFLEQLRAVTPQVLTCNARDPAGRDTVRRDLCAALLAVCPDDFLQPPPLVGDLVPPGGLVVLVTPIDLQAPKGRLILPQVQTLRDILDHDGMAMTVKERELAHALLRLREPPDLVICDSQAVLKTVADTPPQVRCTTFSILFARIKGDLAALAAGAGAIDRLRDGHRVLIAEACTHHALEDDIGRVKIPRWLRQYTGADLRIETVAGRDFPSDLSNYALVVQCGGCMLNRREMLSRIHAAAAAEVPITNFGLCIAHTQGVLARVLQPFPAVRLPDNLTPNPEPTP